MRCVSQVGKTFTISKANFETILKEKRKLVNNKLHILSAKNDTRIIDMIERRGKLRQQMKDVEVTEGFQDLIQPKWDPDRNEEYRSKYCTFEMNENDLKNIKLNTDDVVPLTEYVQRTEEHEIDFPKWSQKRRKDQQRFLKPETQPVMLKYQDSDATPQQFFKFRKTNTNRSVD